MITSQNVTAPKLDTYGLTDDESAYLHYLKGVSQGNETKRAKRFMKQIKEVDTERERYLYHDVYDSAEKKVKEIEARELDPGVLAALLGYDAILVGGHGKSGSYTVILNRTKLVILEQ